MEKNDIPVKLQETYFWNILIALLVIFVTIVIFIIYQRKKSARRAILLTGLCDTGKTLLYSQLVHRQYVNTHTSMKENIGDYPVNGNSLRIIDIPGHERVRDKFFDHYKTGARAIVYVVDSTTIQREVRDVADYLYNILSDPVIAKNGLSLGILCNKQDVPLSKNNKAVKSMLEKELTTLQVTKSSQLESVDPKSKRTKTLIQGGDKFDFSLLPSLQVDFIDSNATSEKDGTANIEALEKWLLKIA